MNAPHKAIQFPLLEGLIDSENFDGLNKSFISSYEKLEKISQAKGDLSRKKSAKKAMRALELTMNLLRDFMKIKEELIRKGMSPEK